jgi:hypothetical protein
MYDSVLIAPARTERADAGQPSPPAPLPAAQPASPVAQAPAAATAVVVCIAGCSGPAGKVVDAQPLPAPKSKAGMPGLIQASLAVAPPVQAADTIVCVAGCYSSPRSYAARPSAIMDRLAARPLTNVGIAAPTIGIARFSPAAVPAPVAAPRAGTRVASAALGSRPAKARLVRSYRSSEWFTSRFRSPKAAP